MGKYERDQDQMSVPANRNDGLFYITSPKRPLNLECSDGVHGMCSSDGGRGRGTQRAVRGEQRGAQSRQPVEP